MFAYLVLSGEMLKILPKAKFLACQNEKEKIVYSPTYFNNIIKYQVERLILDKGEPYSELLGWFEVSPFTCIFNYNYFLEENKERIINNNGNLVVDLSKAYRKRFIEFLSKHYGLDKADEYMEKFMQTPFANEDEYKQLQSVAGNVLNKRKNKEMSL